MMSTVAIVVIICATFWVSVAATPIVRTLAIRFNMLDVPNERSSHTIATARGGGVTVVLVFVLFSSISLLFTKDMDWYHYAALLSGGALVAIVGLLDDYRHVPAPVRLVVHFLAAALALYFLRDLPNMSRAVQVDLGAFVYVPLALMVVWFINLYNFMDGIDGLAAMETIFISTVGGAFLFVGGYESFAVICWVLAAASAGFLIWNVTPSKVFMGDVGSGFLGYTITIIMLASHARLIQISELQSILNVRAPRIWPWLILLSVMIVDASVTLARRILRRERFWQAHRTHAYQHAARRWGHMRTTAMIMGINIFFLAPCAMAAWHWVLWRLQITAGVWGVLAVLALCLDAGKPEPEEDTTAGA